MVRAPLLVLVVALSACESGLGHELGGAGLVGLARAFQYAGARSIVASLWGVSDRSTSVLMQRFYSHLQDGSPLAEALRQAQLDLLQGRVGAAAETSHPFHWAAFRLIGPAS